MLKTKAGVEGIFKTSPLRIHKTQQKLLCRYITESSPNTSKGSSQVFLRKMEENNRRPMGSGCYSQGLRKLEFQEIPPFSGIWKTKIAKELSHILLGEGKELLNKNAIETVPVINLRPVNRYLVKKHFKMSKVLNLVTPQDWAITIDLSDAYFHIPIFPKHRKYLRFCIQGQCYQWKVLCFGPPSAPRVFTKVVSVVAEHSTSEQGYI